MNKQILRNTIFIGLFLIPFVPFLVSSSLFFPFITTKAFAWRLIVEIIFGAWLVLTLVDETYRPRKSPVLYAIGAFLLVIGLADLFGAAPLKSFWSNFERMEGYITLLHLGAFFLVISSVFKELDWKRWWNTSLVASAFMIAYCLFQIAGVFTINQGGVRVDGTLGNAIYLAVYMLFHIFVALFYMLRQWRNRSLRYFYMLLIAMQMLVLYFTATRGAILALLGGLLVLALLNVRNKEEQGIRKLSIGVLVAVTALVGTFFLVRNSAFVQESPVLGRFASLSLSELRTQGRYFIWPMAWEGFKEKPILGWGQENFSYVFQEYYRPEMHSLEPWFDRAHNIFLDWMVAGGVLGIVAYLSLYGAALYVIWKSGFSMLERSVLVALLSAYFFHNVFVFDNLISYILFFSLLGHLHSRYEESEEPLWRGNLTSDQATKLGLPLVVLATIAIVYFVNWRPLVTNTSLIAALTSIQTGAPQNSTPAFEKAFASSYLGRTEVTEQAASNAPSVIGSNTPTEIKNTYYEFVRKAIAERSADIEDDARLHLLAGSFFGSFGQFEEARNHLERAVGLMPQKQMIHFELGALAINQNNDAKALQSFRTAYELAPEYQEAKLIYLIGAIYAGDRALESKLLGEVEARVIAFDDRVVTAYYSNGRMEKVIEIILARKSFDPANATAYDQYLKDLGN
jgi:O-antigen ligase